MRDGGRGIEIADGFGGDPAVLFEGLAAVATDPLYALDGDGRFVAVNEQLVRFVGRPAESLLGEHVRTVLDDESGLRSLELMTAKATGDGTTVAGEFELATAAGRTRLCELEIAPLSPGGGGEAVVGTARDRTGDRRREERLLVLDRVLRHNLRNKIGTVFGYLEMLQAETDDPEVVEMVETARGEADELLAISNKARRFHRLLELEPTRTTVEDLSAVLEPVVESNRGDYPDATIRLSTGSHDPVVVDAELLSAAVDEVIDNAVEHATTGDRSPQSNTGWTGDGQGDRRPHDDPPEGRARPADAGSRGPDGRRPGAAGPDDPGSAADAGADDPGSTAAPGAEESDGPTVEVAVEDGDGRVHVHVADDGPGMDPEEREAVLSGEEDPLYHASGLGFWLVKWALQLTGGELDIRDNEPRGTVVTLSLPGPDAGIGE